jgi:hypothetical protein
MYTTAYIASNEANYFRSRYSKITIDLGKHIKAGKVKIASASVDDIDDLKGTFSEIFLKTLDPGEIEALALIQTNTIKDAKFCTTDGHAIEALAMLHKSSSGISLEELFLKIGFRRSTSSLHHDCTIDFFKKHMRIGGINLVTRYGLVSKSP